MNPKNDCDVDVSRRNWFGAAAAILLQTMIVIPSMASSMLNDIIGTLWNTILHFDFKKWSI